MSAPADPTNQQQQQKDSVKTGTNLPGEVIIDGDRDLHEILQALRNDEVAPLSQSGTNRRTLLADQSYARKVVTEFARYLRFVANTWISAVSTTLFGGLNPFDLFSVWFFAIAATIFLFFVLIFCLLANIPWLVDIYFAWSKKAGGGLGLVNSLNPNLFKSLTPDQARVGKAALGAPFEKEHQYRRVRTFNLDIAKILLQLSSVVYEHEVTGIKEAVGLIAIPKTEPTSTAPISAAASIEPTSATHPDSAAPGRLVHDRFGEKTGSKVKRAMANQDKAIHEFAESIQINYEPVTELGDTSGAFCALFWDSYSNWIVVAFKGTGPIEFGEWLSDFNASLVSSGSYLDNFQRVHKGFKDRVFPDEVSDYGEVRPYDNIALAIRSVSKKLQRRNPNVPVNVWFTGHSLGCATASLAYSGFLSRPSDLGRNTFLRDAYLFAAPICTDRASVDAFNFKMTEDRKKPKTMWRITSNNDAVATLLPELGDVQTGYISPNNNFAFAHLGTEVILKDAPSASHVTGRHLIRGTPVIISSAFTAAELAAQRALKLSDPKERTREWWGKVAQKIPLAGRLIAHCTVNYWDQLDRVAVERCKWVLN